MKKTRKRTKSKERENQLTVEGERRREREEERAKQRASFFFETSGKKRKEKKKKKESLISFLLLSCSLSRGYIIITALSFIYFLLCAVVAKGDVSRPGRAKGERNGKLLVEVFSLSNPL
jgi:hypothetical protein